MRIALADGHIPFPTPQFVAQRLPLPERQARRQAELSRVDGPVDRRQQFAPKQCHHHAHGQQECLPLPWARPWPLQTHTPKTARGLLQREAFRDELSARAADAAHQVMLSQLRTELRTRHYSLRTEQAYEHWMRRFVIFHKLKSPRVLG
jgi:hypothetical protein